MLTLKCQGGGGPGQHVTRATLETIALSASLSPAIQCHASVPLTALAVTGSVTSTALTEQAALARWWLLWEASSIGREWLYAGARLSGPDRRGAT